MPFCCKAIAIKALGSPNPTGEKFPSLYTIILPVQFYYCKRFNGKFFIYYMTLHKKSSIFGASGSSIKGEISIWLTVN